MIQCYRTLWTYIHCISKTAAGYPADHITGKGGLKTGMNFISTPFLSNDFLLKVREVLGA